MACWAQMAAWEGGQSDHSGPEGAQQAVSKRDLLS